MEKKKVVIGMSGGVDSSVAAYLLKEQGYDVIGVTMHIWQKENSNNGMQAEVDAKKVADALGIDSRVVNFEEEFKATVVEYFVKEYLSGRTPNPCNVCNRYIKWECLLRTARGLGADYVATGHYARIDKLDNGRYALCNSITSKKDQTYALYNLTQEQLMHTIMPIGAYEKDDIRKMAADIGLDVASKADSQDICFIPDGDYATFIRNNCDVIIEPGEFVDKEGRVLGVHKGITNYTIGQRKGLNVGGIKGEDGGRWFVIEKDLKNNILYLSHGDEEKLYSSALECNSFNWIPSKPKNKKFDCMSKFRYRQPEQKVTVEIKEDKILITFAEKQRAITLGQYAVLYDEDKCLGGGVIEKVIF